ncbi:hypothetical protein D0962_35195 [Leptolyngbyaceae cyanobacterium CCMR0082]|uniref:Uncharacterized protein n=2 Tax=Adonisia turfae TaxID=2950184 RepID=A0A6M0SHA0_9CYAN|nr:hypothetical protein [Adonisia turfae]MDV3348182.1 hypothetical protein [Leptothoe sp. LEGE 181152]NEZ60853.1 hypothetical protein [Adonisia turfae CCMR0081]NEZ67928.1 hypothetical protein [Adonisia turfae CCMR0082]
MDYVATEKFSIFDKGAPIKLIQERWVKRKQAWYVDIEHLHTYITVSVPKERFEEKTIRSTENLSGQ